MTIDRVTRIEEDFRVRNLVPFYESFEHPWFFDTYKHRLMEDYSEEFVHLRAINTGVIYQFRLDFMPTLRKPSILITSTAEDTMYVFANKQPSFDDTLKRLAYAGRERPSKTAYNGIVKYGGYIRENYDKLMNGLKDADAEISDKSLKLILQSLQRRKEDAEKRITRRSRG